MPTDYERPGNAPTTAELRSAIATIHKAARCGCGYHAELDRGVREHLLIDAITINLTAGERVDLAETILGAAVAACIGPSYVSEHLAQGSLGAEGREAAHEWAEGRPPADECFRRLMRANNAAFFWPPGGAKRAQIEAEAAEVLWSRGEREARTRAEAERRAAEWAAGHRRRRRRAPCFAQVNVTGENGK